MSPDTEKKLDYAAFLADMETKRAMLDQAIASLKAVMAAGALTVNVSGDLGGLADGVPLVALHNGDIPAGAFLGKSIPEAAKLYLSIVKRKQTSREIAEALKKYGIETTSKNFNGLVHSILDRARKLGSGIVKLDRSYWGLAEWYPVGLRTVSGASVEKRPGKRRRGRPPKNQSKTNATNAQPEGPKPKERVLQVLRNQPGMELSVQELAEHLRMQKRAVNMVLISLVRQRILQKTAGGKYRAVTA